MANDDTPPVASQPPIPPGGHVLIQMTPEQARAFRAWQDLDEDDRDSLIWMARHHPSIVRLVNVERWAGQTGSLLIKVFSAAALVMGILVSARQLGIF